MISDVTSEYVPPRLKEYNITQIWERITENDLLASYFPPCHGKMPSKKYLFKVLNTVSPNFVDQLLANIDEIREVQRPEDDQVIMTQDMVDFLENKRISKFGKNKNTLKLLKRGRRWGRRRERQQVNLNFELNVDPRYR